MSAAFALAPASERALSAGAYLLGVLALALIALALAYAAWRLRVALLPAWNGALGRLVEIVLAIGALVLLAELLGTFGALQLGWMIAAALALAAGFGLASPRLERALAGTGSEAARAGSPPAPAPSRLGFWLAALACAAVAAAWMVPTLASLAGGMDRADTLWYHGPLSARFVQTGEVGQVFHFDPIFLAAYYPANSELLHAVPILAFDRDILSPLLNLGFVALGLLSAWCIGRPYGLGPQALIGGAIALGAQNLVEFQAGEALNDIVGVAFLLAAAAVLVNAGATPGGLAGRPALAIAGLAAGLAAGTKLSFLAPAAVLLLGVAAIAGRGNRLRAAGWFGAAAVAGGGYWFARNLLAVGNPIPFTSWGPLGLPAPERTFELREGFSVAHYWNDLDVWSDWFAPGLEESFGALWPLTLVAVVGAGAVAVWRGREPVLRMLGAAVLAILIAYVFTPLTAAGEQGMPIAFEWNVRYVAPAAAIALAILPCLPDTRATPGRRAAVLAMLATLLAATIVSLVQWQQGHLKGAVAAGIAVLTAFAVAAVLRGHGPRALAASPRRRRGWIAAGVAAIAAAALAGGWWEQNHYLERRYENTSAHLRLAEALRWARDLRDARVAVGGVRGVFNQYPFYGTDLSNRVQWLGKVGEDGIFLRLPSCAEWRRALAEGGYTHVVTTYDPFNPGGLTDTKEGLWTRRDPAARELLRDGPVSVFELERAPNPGACDDLPRLTASELNGDSVNIDPTANQPR